MVIIRQCFKGRSNLWEAYKRTRLAWLKVADANIAISRPIASQLTSIDCKNVVRECVKFCVQ